MREFDLIVIGSSSGLNRGCIHSKLPIHSADVAETIRGAGQFGINAEIRA